MAIKTVDSRRNTQQMFSQISIDKLIAWGLEKKIKEQKRKSGLKITIELRNLCVIK